MAGITTIMQIYDRMTPVLRTIQTNFNNVIDRATAFQNTMSRPANVTGFQADNAGLTQVNQNITRVSNNAAVMRRQLTSSSGAARAMVTDTSAMAGNMSRADRSAISTARNAATMRHQFSRAGNDTAAVNRNISVMASNTTRVRTGVESISRSTMAMNNSLTSTNIAINTMNSNMERVLNSISGATQQQNAFNNSASRGSGIISGMAGHLKGMLGIYAAFRAAKAGIEATDNYTNSSARLGLINDGLQTQAGLQEKIYNAAQRSRGSYNDMAATVAKLGLLAKDAFSSNDETIAFTELMNKAFKVSGASQSERADGMYQLTQAMASGRLQGDEFRSIIENAPMLANAIGEYTGKGMAGLKELSSQGAISAEIIKNSLFMAGDEIEEKFATMPKTFGDIWVDIKNYGTREFWSLMETVTEFNNSSVGEGIVDGIKTSISALAQGLEWVIALTMSVGTFFQSNWGVIGPIMWAIVTAVTAYTVVMGAGKVVTLASAVAHGVASMAVLAHQVMTDKWTVSSFKAIAAQWGLNRALLACPFTWIAVIILIIVTVIYVAIAAFNKFAGTSISATGVICGAFFTAGAFIANVIMGLIELVFGFIEFWYNGFIAIANFLANVFVDPIGAVIRLFGDMADNVLGVLEKIASAMDFIFGSNMAATVQGWRGDLSVKVNDWAAKYGNGEYKEKFEKLDINSLMSDLGVGLERIDYGEAWGKGYSFGEKFVGGIDLMNDVTRPQPGFGSDTPDYLEDIADNTGAMRDSMEKNKEDLKYMRDIAEREAITKKIEIKVDARSTNKISDTVDLDGMVTYLEGKLQEALSETAEGVHV